MKNNITAVLSVLACVSFGFSQVTYTVKETSTVVTAKYAQQCTNGICTMVPVELTNKTEHHHYESNDKTITYTVTESEDNPYLSQLM